jgi:hypothetical protein
MLSGLPSVEGEPPEAEAPAAATKSRRWLRIPKAVLITVLGLALSAWLIPAMTRQWDDRQKQHELEAAVVANMASATARALVGGEAYWSGRRLTRSAQERTGDQWALSALEIEARLRTYFPRSVVAGWEVYSWAVDRFIHARNVSAAAALQDAVSADVRLDPRVSDAAAQLLVFGKYTVEPAPKFGVDPTSPTKTSDQKNLGLLEKMLSSDVKRYRDEQQSSPVVSKWTALEKRLLGFEQAVADQVLRSHAAGFSTTAGDLLHDLIP